MADAPSMSELLGDDTATNWGEWGPDDQVRCLNHLDASQVPRGVWSVKSGPVFTHDLADACAADGRWDFLSTAAPLKIHEATGAP